MYFSLLGSEPVKPKHQTLYLVLGVSTGALVAIVSFLAMIGISGLLVYGLL